MHDSTRPIEAHPVDSGTPIPSIRCTNFIQQVLQAKRMVLVLCTLKNDPFAEQKEVIDFVFNAYGDHVKVCLLDEEFIPQFCQEYNVKGTPTFLFFSEGKEIDRILGCADCRTISKYLARHILLYSSSL
jgi:thioredoxin-like negative regulator of GroEL